MWKIISLALIYFGKFGSSQIIDMTYGYDPHNGTTPSWGMTDVFNFTVVHKKQTATFYYESNAFCTAEHAGTHLDAPAHFSKGGTTVDKIPLKQLIGSPYFIDVSDETPNNPNLQVSVRHLEDAESKQGRIPNGAIVMIYCGWSLKYYNLTDYFGGDPKNSSTYHFPGLHADAAKWLVEKREISALGIDTPSVDCGQCTDFGTHVALYTNSVPGFESVDMSKISEIRKMKDPMIIALPMKIGGGSGGPLRIIAMETPTRSSSSPFLKNTSLVIGLLFFVFLCLSSW